MKAKSIPKSKKIINKTVAKMFQSVKVCIWCEQLHLGSGRGGVKSRIPAFPPAHSRGIPRLRFALPILPLGNMLRNDGNGTGSNAMDMKRVISHAGLADYIYIYIYIYIHIHIHKKKIGPRGTFKFLHRPINPIPKISRTRVGRVREIRWDREEWGGATYDFSHFPISL